MTDPPDKSFPVSGCAQVTLTLTRLNEPDDLLREVLKHLSLQTGLGGEILLIEQKRSGFTDAQAFSNDAWTCRIINRRLRGLSQARNLSLGEARHDHVLFCDADALAAPDWALHLHRALCLPDVAVAGSRILPRWSGRPPVLATSRVVRDQYSLYDLGDGTFDVGRVVGAGFGLDRAKHADQMHFDEALGRRDGRLFGGEESDLCSRITRAGGRVVYVGASKIGHVIQPERLRTAWIMNRLFHAGLGRGNAGGGPRPSRRPSLADWALLPVILPPYALGWIWGKITRK